MTFLVCDNKKLEILIYKSHNQHDHAEGQFSSVFLTYINYNIWDDRLDRDRRSGSDERKRTRISFRFEQIVVFIND